MKRIILVIVLSSFLHAQDASQLFAKFIPQKYHNSVENINTVNTILNSIPEINTDLFFYLIEALQIDASNDSNELFNKIVKHIDYEKYKNNTLYNKWIKKQIDLINQSNLEEDIKSKAYNNFDSLTIFKKNITPIQFPFVIDSNKISFYKLIYISGVTDSEYDPLIDYTKYVENHEKSILNEFRLVQNELKEGTYPHTLSIPLFDKMKKNWDVFFRRVSKNDSLNEYIIDYYVYNYKIKDNFSQFEISVFYNRNSLLDYTHSGPTGTPLLISINNNIKTNQVGFSLGYSFKLKEQKSIFSKLNFNISYANGQIGNSKKLEDLENEINTINFNRKNTQTFTVKFINSNFNIKSLNYFGLSLSVPIYYLSPYIHLSFGGRVFYNSLDYELEYDYESTAKFTTVDVETNKILDEGTNNFSGKYKSDSNFSSFGVEPFVLIEYLLLKNINIGINLGIKYFSLYSKLEI